MSEQSNTCQSFDVLVIGGGIVGLSSAIAMAMRGFSVAVLDTSDLSPEHVQENTRVYAINKASQALLTALGAWELLPSVAKAPYRAMHIWDAHHQAAIDFHAREIAKHELGFMMKESDLKRALLLRAKALDVILNGNTRMRTCTEVSGGMYVEDEHHQAWHAKLVMAADGALSYTRTLLKVKMTTKSYAQDALVATVKTEKAHNATAYQVFHPEGPLAFLPLQDAHECSIVWSFPPAQVKQFMTMDESEFNAALTKAFASKLGQVQVCSQRFAFPLHMRHVKQYVGKHWMLLGDAAHTIHPLAGLGLNVGLADLSTWLKHLDTMPDKAFSTRLLNAYERERKHEVWSVIALMQGIKTLFGTRMTLLGALRGHAMRILNQLGPLKRELIHYASGVDKLAKDNVKSNQQAFL